MRRFPARFIRPESFVHTRSSAGFTITTSGFKFSVHTAIVHEILQWGPHASIPGERCTDLARRRSRQAHSLSPNPGRTASPICPDLIYDRHTRGPGSMYSPRMRLASLMARRTVSWSGLFITATHLNRTGIQDWG